MDRTNYLGDFLFQQYKQSSLVRQGWQQDLFRLQLQKLNLFNYFCKKKLLQMICHTIAQCISPEIRIRTSQITEEVADKYFE